MRVAMIADEFDLGTAGLLFGQPKDYAKFLAQELANFNSDWVLIVMPNGYGIYHCVPIRRAEGYVDPCEKQTPTREADEKLLRTSLPALERAGGLRRRGEVAVRRAGGAARRVGGRGAQRARAGRGRGASASCLGVRVHRRCGVDARYVTSREARCERCRVVEAPGHRGRAALARPVALGVVDRRLRAPGEARG